MLKFLKISALVLLLIIIVIFIGLHLFLPMRPNDASIRKHFEEQELELTIHHQNFEGRPIRFVETNQKKEIPNTLIVFVHGAPGNYDAFEQYLADPQLLAQARMISIDRLGYGDSDFGNAENSLTIHGRMLQFIVKQYETNRVLLVGHSYGGPIVAKCAMDYPDLIDQVLMLAPVIDPEHEKIFIFSYPTKWKATKWLFPKTLQVTGIEKFAHANALAEIAADWKTLSVPTTHIHGAKDNIAPPINLDFSKKHIPTPFLKVIELPEANHFIPWSNYEVVKKELMDFLKEE